MVFKSGDRPHNWRGGIAGTTEWHIWHDMRRRCRDETRPAWKNYGGRGIEVCKRWEDSFEAFLADMGPRPSKGHSIDRIDNDGPYAPENCRWATRKEQKHNSRKGAGIGVRLISAHGKTLCLRDWTKEFGVPHQTISQRLKGGWIPELAVKEPCVPHIKRSGLVRPCARS